MRPLAVALALYWPLAVAEEPQQEQQIICRDGWCLVRQDQLSQMVTNMQALAKHVQELRWLCKWEPKP